MSENPKKSKGKCRLPRKYPQIVFKVDGKELAGKVMTKHKNSSLYRNIIGIRLRDGKEEEFDFSKDNIEWENNTEFIETEEELSNEIFATVLTKSQVKRKGVEA